MARAAAAALAALLVACQQQPAPAPQKTETPEQRLEASAVVLVRKSLRDPESGRFRGVATLEIGPEGGQAVRVICGYVNAKNGFGGYTGEQPWYVMVFQDGTAGACVGDTKDCDYILGRPAHLAAHSCVDKLGQ